MPRPATIAGQIELRGRGIVSRPNVNETEIALVFDLVAAFDRMPPETEFESEVEGVRLARAPIPSAGLTDGVHRRLLALEAIAAIGSR